MIKNSINVYILDYAAGTISAFDTTNIENIEELKPYDENPQGVLMKNSDGELEYAPVGKTARLISYINLDIINVARGIHWQPTQVRVPMPIWERSSWTIIANSPRIIQSV